MGLMNAVAVLCLAAAVALSSSFRHVRRSSFHHMRRRTAGVSARGMLGGNGAGMTGEGTGNTSLSFLWGQAKGPYGAPQEAAVTADADGTISKGFLPSGPTDLAKVDQVAPVPPRVRGYVAASRRTV